MSNVSKYVWDKPLEQKWSGQWSCFQSVGRQEHREQDKPGHAIPYESTSPVTFLVLGYPSRAQHGCKALNDAESAANQELENYFMNEMYRYWLGDNVGNWQKNLHYRTESQL